MPWQRLQDWVESRPDVATSPQLELARPLTLVTIALRPEVQEEEVRFYRDAEFELLSGWAGQGALLLALVSLKGNELTLLCPMPLRRARAMIEDLPLVSAGLANASLKPVVPFRQLAHARSDAQGQDRTA